MTKLEKHLHIVSFDVPFPADYGGVIDVFYKIKALHELGVKIHLHCFEYGRGQRKELEDYCAEVHYYNRKSGHHGFSNKLPYIVCSRSDDGLLKNLLKDDYPVLLEGIHCTYFLNNERLAHRKVLLRLHNVEYRYYKNLFHQERSLPKKIYYLNESRLLKKYEHAIAYNVPVLAISQQDAISFHDELGLNEISYLPVFHPVEQVGCMEGLGCYCLYHGNLSVAENEAAVIWLLKNVFNELKLPFVIAGKKPSTRLQKLAHKHSHTCLVADPGEQEMVDIICKAQINILPSFNNTGIKLKLLNAVFNGRHCVASKNAVALTGLETECYLAQTADDFKQWIAQLYEKPFTWSLIKEREALLLESFDNRKNAQQLIASIW